jgi:hypothetical protein
MRPAQRRRLLLGATALLCLLCACSSPSRVNGRAPDDPSPFGWERIGRAARNAALAPETWAPVAGALVLQMGDADRKIQTYAAQQTPLFGSQRNADQRSDDLKLASSALWAASALAPAPGDEGDDWLGNKAKVVAVQASANMVLSGAVGYLKDETHRTRPNGLGATSFPSDHASRSALHTTMSLRNVKALGWSDRVVSNTQIGLYSLTGVTAWARIEANQHYPSDVLCGMALGHFFGAFFTDALVGSQGAERVQVLFAPARDRTMMLVRFSY